MKMIKRMHYLNLKRGRKRDKHTRILYCHCVVSPLLSFHSYTKENKRDMIILLISIFLLLFFLPPRQKKRGRLEKR